MTMVRRSRRTPPAGPSGRFFFARNPRVAAFAVWACVAATLAAEPGRPAFLDEAPVFAPEPAFLPRVGASLDARQGLDQTGEPLFGHALETAATFDFYSSPRFALSGHSRSIFDFSANPLGPFLFKTRQLVSVLGLRASMLAGPTVVGATYRHDCAHGIGDDGGREPIHDGFGLFARPAAPFVFDAIGGRGEVDGMADIEFFVPPMFQQAPLDADRFRLSLAASASPVKMGNVFALALDGRLAAFVRADQSDPDASLILEMDWSLALALEARGDSGKARLYLSLERVTDAWRDADATDHLVPAFGLSFSGGFGR